MAAGRVRRRGARRRRTDRRGGPLGIFRTRDEQFAIELFITDNTDPARVERFLVRARELVPLGELFVIPVARGGQYRLRVIFGEFPSRAAAIEAGKRLPPRYQQAFRASPRSFAELRGQI